jgi:hypothetical protein
MPFRFTCLVLAFLVLHGIPGRAHQRFAIRNRSGERLSVWMVQYNPSLKWWDSQSFEVGKDQEVIRDTSPGYRLYRLVIEPNVMPPLWACETDRVSRYCEMTNPKVLMYNPKDPFRYWIFAATRDPDGHFRIGTDPGFRP